MEEEDVVWDSWDALAINEMKTLSSVFIVLKGAGLVSWSWWFVLSPFLVSLVVAVIGASVRLYRKV